LTDAADGNTDMQVQYSYWPVFNGNCTRIHVVGTYAGVSRSLFFSFDPATSAAGIPFKLEASPPQGFLLDRSDMIWSGTSPDHIYGHNEVHRLWAYNVASQLYTMIKDFSSSMLPNGNLAQMSRSLDDQVFAFTLTDALGEPAGYLVWNRGRDQILVREEVPNLNEVQVDKSGRYLIVVYVDGHDEVFDLAPFPPTLIATLTKASGNAFVHYDSGHGTLFHDYDPSKSLVLSRLATPTVFQQIIPGVWSYGTQDDHFSMLADNEGWALSSRFSISGGPVLNPFDNEIVQVSTDGSDRVRRIAHHRSLVSVYEDQPKASISRDGRYVAFTSNWGQVSGRRDVYIIVNIPPAPTS
jgi:carbon monoxide dehydrogenase subunit G